MTALMFCALFCLLLSISFYLRDILKLLKKINGNIVGQAHIQSDAITLWKKEIK